MAEPRVAVITGASSGIGAELARALAPRGWRCVLLARRRERLEALAAEVDGEVEVCDVADREGVERVAAAVRARHPAVDLLANNAGVPGRAGFLDLEADRIEQIVRINYLGSVWCLRAFLPALEASPRAHVVNVVSVAGTVAWPASGPYAAAKHAQLAFSRAVAAELRGRVRVHTVSPGFVHTEGFPNRDRFPRPLDRLVPAAGDVARHIVSVVERDRGETFVPGWYRVGAVAQALAPNLLARLLANPRVRRLGQEER